jgi:cellulose synthase/poly-beta-1,6-N-acetylglucosamine synthase-like glycosyltransferase/beta-mannanase
MALLYEFLILPTTFLYFVLKAKLPKKRIAPKNKKVAVISLCVPAVESLDIVENQIRAMANIEYPHDSWILDEGNSPQIKAIADKYGVKHFSRKGVKAYNKSTPPFMKKTKAGNVNAWIDHVKDIGYDYFVQLDIDHIPKPNYLNKTLGYFRDDKVAWVQAPSVYKNLDSWTARGAAEQELVLQGPLQMGFYGFNETPFIIGSHCTYRMKAISEIGGFQPTRAEDHLDTVLLASRGYRGVFLPEIIAEGDGPETLNTYLAQQFAWAYSMFQVLLGYTPKLLKTMTWKRKLQFLFAQTWYPLWSLSYLILFMSPLIALAVGKDVVQINPIEMIIHFLPAYLAGFLVWWSAKPIMQPSNVGLTWRGVALHAVRWPIILRAILAAAFKIKKPYMITPKGSFADMVPSVATYRPFLLFGLLSAVIVLAASVLREGEFPVAQAVYSITNAIFMLAICAIDLGLRLKNSQPRLNDVKKHWLRPIFATLGLSAIIVSSTLISSYTFAQSSGINNISVNNKPLAVNNQMTTEQLISQIRMIPAHQEETSTLGIYNPGDESMPDNQHYIRHSFVDWRDDHYLAMEVAQSLQTGNTPLVTIEPRGEANGAKLLDDIIAGAYDQRLDNLAEVLKASKNPVYIRFGHEMDLGNLYPWGDQSPGSYIEAYRHVSDRLRADNAQSVRFVWSPAGNPGAEIYYPGDQYVDVVGTTILFDRYWYGNLEPNFSTLAQSREWLQGLGKPVWIVEFGAGRSDKAYQQKLINDAIEQYNNLGFSALVYLNMADANIIGPDYRLNSPQEFSIDR